MHKFASLDHRIKPVEEIYLPAASSAAFYGRSVFTSAAVYNSAIFQWEKHWRRLTENSFRLGIDLSKLQKEEIEKSISDLIAANRFQNGRIRVTIFEASAAALWSPGAAKKTSLLINSAAPKISRNKLRLTISPFPLNSKSPLANLKSGNYLENILALEEAGRRGFDEAARVNENGKIVSAVTANIFWVKDEKIYTAPLETGALRGTTRDWVEENFRVAENEITPGELKSADEIFITSGGIGIAEIKSFEEKIFTNFAVSRQVQKFFKEITENLTSRP